MWELLNANGECQDVRFAYNTKCVTHEAHILSLCLATLCSLLATTDPSCVVVHVSQWVFQTAGMAFARNGVRMVVVPEAEPLHADHPYLHLLGSTGKSNFSRRYTFAKLEAFGMTQYERVAVFDADVLFMRNGSGLQDMMSEAFLASRLPKGKDQSVFVQSGMMVIRPSENVYRQLRETWRIGNFSLHYSNEEVTDQDVIIELCWIQARCGPRIDLDACVFNHGSWLPGKFWRECRQEDVVARHNFYSWREKALARDLESAFHRGTCRPRSTQAFQVSEEKSRSVGDVDSTATCSATAALSDADRLQRVLANAGVSWFGLTSQPDMGFDVTDILLDGHCWERCNWLRSKFQLDEGVHPESDGPSGIWHPSVQRAHRMQRLTPEKWIVDWGAGIAGCEALRSPCLSQDAGENYFVSFQFRFRTYFSRHLQHESVRSLYHQFLGDLSYQRSVRSLFACVPDGGRCLLPHGQISINHSAYHAALQPSLGRLLVGLLAQYGPPDARLHLPAPIPSDFETIRIISSGHPEEEWRLCYRE